MDKVERIKGLDIVQDLLNKEMLALLNARYMKLANYFGSSEDGNALSDRLREIAEKFKAAGLRFSNSPAITEEGVYNRFVFREKFILLFPDGKYGEVKICKNKRTFISEEVSFASKDLPFCPQADCVAFRRETIGGDDIREFEKILGEISEKIKIT